MKVTKCDKCGKIIPDNCRDERSTITYQGLKKGSVYTPRDFDLCHECSKSFVKWIKAPGNVN